MLRQGKIIFRNIQTARRTENIEKKQAMDVPMRGVRKTQYDSILISPPMCIELKGEDIIYPLFQTAA